MGADAFIVFYGTRYQVGDADAADALNEHSDPRLGAAKHGGHDIYIGRVTEDAPYYLFIGRRLGILGVEGETLKEYSAHDFAGIAKQTDEAITSLGLPGQPQFWFQLQAQY
jgi:hypothetical protein